MKKLGRLMEVIFAAGLSGLGINLIVAANIGSDPLTIFQQGISNAAGVQLATAIFLVNCATIAVAFLLNWHAVGVATIINPLVVSIAVSTLQPFVVGLQLDGQSILLRLIVVLLAQGCCSSGFGIMIAARLGPHAIDVSVQQVAKKMTVPYTHIRYALDTTMCLFGWLLGGVVGVGTVVCVLTQGPLVMLASGLVGRLRINLN